MPDANWMADAEAQLAERRADLDGARKAQVAGEIVNMMFQRQVPRAEIFDVVAAVVAFLAQQFQMPRGELQLGLGHLLQIIPRVLALYAGEHPPPPGPRFQSLAHALERTVAGSSLPDASNALANTLANLCAYAAPSPEAAVKQLETLCAEMNRTMEARWRLFQQRTGGIIAGNA